MISILLLVASALQTQTQGVERRIHMAQEAEARMGRMQHREVKQVQPVFVLTKEEQRMHERALRRVRR